MLSRIIPNAVKYSYKIQVWLIPKRYRLIKWTHKSNQPIVDFNCVNLPCKDGKWQYDQWHTATLKAMLTSGHIMYFLQNLSPIGLFYSVFFLIAFWSYRYVNEMRTAMCCKVKCSRESELKWNTGMVQTAAPRGCKHCVWWKRSSLEGWMKKAALTTMVAEGEPGTLGPREEHTLPGEVRRCFCCCCTGKQTFWTFTSFSPQPMNVGNCCHSAPQHRSVLSYLLHHFSSSNFLYA